MYYHYKNLHHAGKSKKTWENKEATVLWTMQEQVQERGG